MTPRNEFEKKLNGALAASDDDAFLQQLCEIDPRYTVIDPEQRPHPLAMFAGLWALHLDVGLDGIWRYLAYDEGNAFDQDLASCRTIGAVKAVDYLESVQRVFPRGRVPKDRDKRSDALERMEEKAKRTGSPDPLRSLDEKFARTAMPELAQRLRAWVATNRTELLRDLAALPAPREKMSDRADVGKTKALLELLALEEDESHEKKVATLRAAAKKAGLIPWKGTADDERHARFIASASALTQKQWTTVAQRYHESKKKVQEAMDGAFALSQQLRSGQLGDRSVHGSRLKRHVEANKALFEVIRSLPKQVVVGGKKVGVLLGAHHAAAAASLAVRLHEWLVLTPRGQEIERNAFAPFEGLAWTPAADH